MPSGRSSPVKASSEGDPVRLLSASELSEPIREPRDHGTSVLIRQVDFRGDECAKAAISNSGWTVKPLSSSKVKTECVHLSKLMKAPCISRAELPALSLPLLLRRRDSVVPPNLCRTIGDEEAHYLGVSSDELGDVKVVGRFDDSYPAFRLLHLHLDFLPVGEYRPEQRITHVDGTPVLDTFVHRFDVFLDHQSHCRIVRLGDRFNAVLEVLDRSTDLPAMGQKVMEYFSVRLESWIVELWTFCSFLTPAALLCEGRAWQE